MSHWIIAPILIPALAGMLLLLEVREWHRLRRITGLLSASALLAVAVLLWEQAADGTITVYQLGNWAAPFGIVLVLDRLTALMLLLTAVLAFPALLYACRGDDRKGANFHGLFQFQLMGINGAFLTGDLFNLFVFFEVLLIASYGLALHGRGPARVKAGLHYVALNLVGSALFLIGLGLIYGTTGTLNMADFAVKAQAVTGMDQALLKVAVLLLWAVFGLKAALFPLYFWLPATYANATAPVAALFAIMTKVGLYAIVRVYALAFADGPLAGLGQQGLWALALTTLALAGIGVLGARRLGTLVAYLVIMSVGTLLAALTFGQLSAAGPALYYLVHSTLICGALFLLADLVARGRGEAGDRFVAGPVIPAGGVLAGLYFMAAIAVVGLPPLSGFIGKVALLKAVPVPLYWVLLLLAGLCGLIGMSRAGSSMFWRTTGPGEGVRPGRQRLLALLVLLAVVPALTLWAEPAMQAAGQVAGQLAQPQLYIQAVLGGQS
ncbi:multisubunit Na+/H+ antiporter, MnhD subunit [Alcanivorax hongdengensis A-11-3]|uniref:Multisubunit Na+/H+ antiporter, MnhD subunit n=1 Tax=Alcanivorax hongdengensis A-11-3 TaxID=1177179 RepID=L0WA81_9GAMM|nr:monovalent cation/H+ antiporter subunit D [Alcanivorax hongdengensis]EKF72987.1 multisubunit Na+/H+ antiporter, MnhD subunit [Alcanivorax hongdengensis A-11-3]